MSLRCDIKAEKYEIPLKLSAKNTFALGDGVT